jgi:Skp family chaperone for outer membrane proteins
LFKDSNYDQNTLLNANLNIPIIDSIEKFIEIRNKSAVFINKQVVYFKPFNIDLFKSTISDVIF